MLKYLEREGIKDGFNSSHALSVAYDSIYGAYLKANYPLEYYTVILNKYENDTEMTNKIYKELSYFNIKVTPIKYGNSKATYTMNKEENAIYKGIGSIKFLNNNVADELYELSSNTYKYFVDLLFDAHNHTTATFKHLRILTGLNFFEDFGWNKKLLDLIDMYESKLKNKKLKEETKEKRMVELRQLEEEMQDSKLNIKEQIKTEIEFYGYETTIIERSPKSVYIISDINTKYTPVIRLYCLHDGSVISAKCKKSDMKKNEFGLFSIIGIKKLAERNKRRKVDGEWTVTDETELYLAEWDVLR